MSDQIETPPAFVPYAVEGIGTVVAHTGDTYEVQALNGSVYGYAAPSGTPSQENAAADIAYALAHPPAFPIDQAALYAAQLAPGYLDAATGIRLKGTEQAQAKFTSAVALVRLAISLGQMADTTMIPAAVWDFDNQPHDLTAADFLALMLRYGLWCKSNFDNFAP